MRSYSQALSSISEAKGVLGEIYNVFICITILEICMYVSSPSFTSLHFCSTLQVVGV